MFISPIISCWVTNVDGSYNNHGISEGFDDL